MTSEKVIYTFKTNGFSKDQKIASMAAILDGNETKAVALVSYLCSGYFLIVVGADDKILREMRKARLKPIHEVQVQKGQTAMLVPLSDEIVNNPVPDSPYRQKQPLTSFVLNQIGPVRALARYPLNSIGPSKSKMNGAMNWKQREALAVAAGFQVPFGA